MLAHAARRWQTLTGAGRHRLAEAGAGRGKHGRRQSGSRQGDSTNKLQHTQQAQAQ